MAKTVIIDGIEYVPKKEKSPTQGLTDAELVNMSLFAADEDPVERFSDGTPKDPNNPDHFPHPF
jgi:hypothetical protein